MAERIVFEGELDLEHLNLIKAVSYTHLDVYKRQHTMTKNRFRITFKMPAIVRYSSGRFVSPFALSTACLLYTS